MAELTTGKFTTDHLRAPHRDYEISIRYILNAGLSQQAPADDPGQASSIYRAHTPSMIKVVEWTATKQLEPPTMPMPESSSENEELAYAEIIPHPLMVDSDAESPVYSVSGIYIYYLYSPVWLDEGLPIGKYPFLQVSPGEKLIRAQFDPNLLG